MNILLWKLFCQILSCKWISHFVTSQTFLQVRWSKRLSCQADLHTVSRCHTRGESEDHTSDEVRKKGFTLALEPRADVTRSPKQWYQWPHEKDWCPPKIKKNKTTTTTKRTCLFDYLLCLERQIMKVNQS